MRMTSVPPFHLQTPLEIPVIMIFLRLRRRVIHRRADAEHGPGLLELSGDGVEVEVEVGL